jgi:hypothetical protein
MKGATPARCFSGPSASTIRSELHRPWIAQYSRATGLPLVAGEDGFLLLTAPSLTHCRAFRQRVEQ